MPRPTPPLLARPGEEPDRSAIYGALLRRWLDVPGPVDRVGRSSDRTMSALADILGVPKQKIGKWSDGLTPPWWIILWLADELGLGVLITATGVALVVLVDGEAPAGQSISGPTPAGPGSSGPAGS